MQRPVLRIESEDPLGVLRSTKRVVEESAHVSINLDALPPLCALLREQQSKGIHSLSEAFGSTGCLESDLQLIFLEDVVNFCFWPSNGERRWEVEWPLGTEPQGGWYGLKKCFERALTEDNRILDPRFLKMFSLDDARKIFHGVGGVEIPMISDRLLNMQEAGRVLFSYFGGKFSNLMDMAHCNVVKLTGLICRYFASFRDVSNWRGCEVRFLKRAQIAAYDATWALGHYKVPFTQVEELAGFPDYKIPQVFRATDFLVYSEALTQKIDNSILLAHDSPEEVSIRAATTWGLMFVSQEMEIMPVEADTLAWMLGQTMPNMKPYHKSRNIYY